MTGHVTWMYSWFKACSMIANLQLALWSLDDIGETLLACEKEQYEQ